LFDIDPEGLRGINFARPRATRGRSRNAFNERFPPLGEVARTTVRNECPIQQKPTLGSPSAGSGNAPNFVVTPSGETIIIPSGASGPLPTRGPGFQYTGGSGGAGLHPDASNVRIMDPTPPRGPSPGYPGGYVNYTNSRGQSVDPYTGRTLSPSDSMWHIPLQPR